MSEFFILQNHEKRFLGRQKEWLDGSDPASLYKTPHKDEAVNQVFEISSKDYTQRIKVVSCKVNEKGLPVIEPEWTGDAQPASASLFTDEAPIPADADADADADDFAAEDITVSADSFLEDDQPEPNEPDIGSNQQSLL